MREAPAAASDWAEPTRREWPKANNRNVLKAYSQDMKRLSEKGLKRQKRPGGYQIRPSFSNVKAGGSIPPAIRLAHV